MDGHFNLRATLNWFGLWTHIICHHCHLLLGLKQVTPFTVRKDEGHGYHPLGARLVEQNSPLSQLLRTQLWSSALLKGTSVMTGIQTHTLLLTTPEIGSSDVARSVTTRQTFPCLHNKQSRKSYLWVGDFIANLPHVIVVIFLLWKHDLLMLHLDCNFLSSKQRHTKKNRTFV